VRSRILLPTLARAHLLQPALRIGRSPRLREVADGHESANLALEVYAKRLQRKRDTGAKMDALVAEGVPIGHKKALMTRTPMRLSS